MPIIHGTIQSTDGKVFYASFDAGRIWSLNGHFDSPIEPFESAESTLEYVKLVAGKPTFEGSVGTSQLSLSFSDGNKIEGPLDKPISQEYRVMGVADVILYK